MRWHGADGEEQGEATSRRRGGGGVGGGGARSSRSPNGRKRRAVAADLFDDENEHDDYHDRRSERRRSSARRSKSPLPGPDSTVRGDHKRRRHHDRRRHHHHPKRPDNPAELPFHARQLSYKHDFDTFRALFAYYLDIQKGIDFYALDTRETRGRWKSFVHKWNRGELAEGWYEPEMYERITKENPAGMTNLRGHSTDDEDEDEGAQEDASGVRETVEEAAAPLDQREEVQGQRGEDQDDVDDYGPPPPPGQSSSTSTGGPRHGPGIPTRGDLTLQREAAAEAAQFELAALRLARKADRVQQKERLDELVPRAEPNTRERQLEKRAMVNEKMRSFREAKGDAMEEVGDKDLMGGGGEDDLAEYKRMMAAQQRKKTERELRREAEARAKAVEREERLREWKEREEEKLKGLKELARARFG